MLYLPFSMVSIAASAEIGATLTLYRPGVRQRTHYHAFHKISFVLAGEVRETLARRTFDLAQPSMGFKPASIEHSDEIGPAGALLFSIRIFGDQPALSPGWSRMGATAGLTRLVHRAVVSGDQTDRVEVLWDLAAFEQQAVIGARGAPPRWLVQAHDEIRDAPHLLRVGEAALAAGVHRVHFSRLFRRYYGVTPSEYRRHCRVARALSRIGNRRESIAAIAHNAGFADQSHLSRELKRATGLPPAILRALFR